MLNTAQERILRERANALRRRCEKALRDGASDAEVDALDGEVKALRRLKEQVDDSNALAGQVEAMRASFGTAAAGKGFARALEDEGWHYKASPVAAVAAVPALGVKAPTVPDDDDLSRQTIPDVAALGQDSRFLYPLIPTRDARGDTSIEDYRQTARSVTGNVERGLTATTEKAVLSTTIEHVVAPFKQWAVILPDIPNAVLEARQAFRNLFDSTMRYEVQKALDGHVISEILDADPPAGTTGSGLVAQIRNAVGAMRAEGSNPSVIALSPEDAASLDLFEDTGGSLVFATRDTGSSSPVWGLRVAEVATLDDPLLLDPGKLGVLALGTIRVDADPFSGFTRNLTRLRAETSGLMHVRDATGARRIGTTS